MKKSFLLTICAVALVLGFSSCVKDENTILDSDPEGTVIANLLLTDDIKGWYERVYIEGLNDACIWMYMNNNFKGYYESISCVGKVNGLSGIKKIPTSGWVGEAAVMPGYGYVVKDQGKYARIYVVDYMESTSGGIMGCTIKYQAPWSPEN